MTALNKTQIENVEKMTGVKVEQTDVTHITRTHTEGRNNGQSITLEQSKDFGKFYIQTVNGDLVQLDNYKKLMEKT